MPLFNANIDTGHLGSWLEPHVDAMAKAATAWRRWQPQGDTRSAKMFQGSDCGLCKDASWTVKTKNFK